MEDIWVRRGLGPFASVFGDADTSWRSVGFPSRIRREDPFMRRTSSRFLYFDPSDLCSGAVIILAFYMRGIQLLELTTPSASSVRAFYQYNTFCWAEERAEKRVIKR